MYSDETMGATGIEGWMAAGFSETSISAHKITRCRNSDFTARSVQCVWNVGWSLGLNLRSIHSKFKKFLPTEATWYPASANKSMLPFYRTKHYILAGKHVA
jgi:hypothetical protein